MTWFITGNSNATTTSFLGTTTPQPLVIKTNNKEAMRVASADGDVSIGELGGTRDPDYKLDVQGILNADDIYKGGTELVGSQWANVPNSNSISYYADGDPSDVSVGIGTDSPSYQLHVVAPRKFDGITLDNGGDLSLLMFVDDIGTSDSEELILHLASNGADLHINGDGTPVRMGNLFVANLIQGSSRELKEDITDFTTGEAMEALENLKPVSFVWKDDEERTTRVGFIAEDTPNIARTADETGVIPMHILAILSKVVKEQQRAITALRRQLGQAENARRPTLPPADGRAAVRGCD